MPELDPASDFQDDGGTRAWRNSHAANVRYESRPKRKPLSVLGYICWFLVYPFCAMVVFYAGSILLMFNGVDEREALIFMFVVIAFPPLNRFFGRR